MKRFFILALAFAAGCSSVQTVEKIPDYSGRKEVAQAERAAYYERMKIADVVYDSGKIGDSWYTLRQIKQIYKQTGSRDARHMANGAVGRKIGLLIAAPVTLGGCAYVGFYMGTAAYASQAKETYTYNGSSYVRRMDYSDANSALIYQGGLIGTGIGVVAAVIEYYVLRSSATHALRQSGDSFNKQLFNDLNLSVAPEPSGVKAGVTKKF